MLSLRLFCFLLLYIVFVTKDGSAHRSNDIEIAKLQLNKLVEWAQLNGAFVSDKIKFEINCYGGEYTTNVVVTKPIKFGERVLKIPNQIFYTFSEKTSIIWKIILEKTGEKFIKLMKQQQQVIMALDLLIKEDKEVKTPYVDFLPRFVYGALDWTNETAELSAHFNLVSKLKARNKTAVNLYESNYTLR